MGLYVIELDGNDLVGGDILQERGVVGLTCADPVPGVQNQLGVVTAGGLDHFPGLAHAGKAAVRHGLHADGVLSGSVAQLFQLLSGPFHGVILHKAAVDVVNTEQSAHMEARLLFVLLLVGALFIGPLYDVLHLSDLHVILLQNSQDVAVEKAFVQCVHIGLCSQSDALKACGFCGGYALLKAALVTQRPGAYSDGMLA